MRDLTANDTMIFLGAGASCADGALKQNELFKEYFLYYNNQPEDRIYHSWDRELATFFLDFFGIDVDSVQSVESARFPTFEEVLGIIEIAGTQNESFRDWGTSHIVDSQQKPRLSHMHDILILLIAEILSFSLQRAAIHHPRLIETLHDCDWLRTTSFISMNYDILIDNALLRLSSDYGLNLDYAIDFVNSVDDRSSLENSNDVALFKLHGSLNWLYCPTCRTMQLTPLEKGICKLKWQPGECVCSKCSTLAVPIVIPPTYFKALSNFYLRQIWHTAERALIECDRIIFCGYSFPDADIHIRYLLKRVEMNRNRSFEVYIVNEHEGKNDREVDPQNWTVA